MFRDLIGQAIEKAIENFGGDDNTFNTAGFQNAYTKIIGVEVDEHLALHVLLDRTDVIRLSGGQHWRLVEQ